MWRLGVREGAGSVVERIRELQGSVSPQYENCLHRVDYRAMVVYAQNRRPSLEEDAAQIQVPCLFYAGDADEYAHQYVREAVHKLANARFFSLPGYNHLGASDAADLLVPEVLSFIAEL